jgi:hypothetical protein
MFLFGYWWMEREQKRTGSKECSFLATGRWNENKNELDPNNVSFWLLVDGTRTNMHWIGEEGEGRKREQRKLRGGEGNEVK